MPLTRAWVGNVQVFHFPKLLYSNNQPKYLPSFFINLQSHVAIAILLTSSSNSSSILLLLSQLLLTTKLRYISSPPKL